MDSVTRYSIQKDVRPFLWAAVVLVAITVITLLLSVRAQADLSDLVQNQFSGELAARGLLTSLRGLHLEFYAVYLPGSSPTSRSSHWRTEHRAFDRALIASDPETPDEKALISKVRLLTSQYDSLHDRFVGEFGRNPDAATKLVAKAELPLFRRIRELVLNFAGLEQQYLLNDSRSISSVFWTVRSTVILAGGALGALLLLIWSLVVKIRSMQRCLTERNFLLDDLVARKTKTLQETNSELEEALSRLRRQDEQRREFLVNVGHEVKTPLAIIQGAAALLLRGDQISASQQALVAERLKGGIGRLSRQLDDLLAASRLEADCLAFSPAPLDLSRILQDIVSTFEPLAKNRDIRLVLQDNLTTWCNADEQRLLQIVGNLLDNAIKFSPPGSIVALRAFPVGSRGRIEVIDQGPGVAERDRQRIFAPRYQGSSIMGGSVGLGMGLAIAATLVDLHRGVIGVDGEQGLGALFFIELPLLVQNESTCTAS